MAGMCHALGLSSSRVQPPAGVVQHPLDRGVPPCQYPRSPSAAPLAVQEVPPRCYCRRSCREITVFSGLLNAHRHPGAPKAPGCLCGWLCGVCAHVCRRWNKGFQRSGRSVSGYFAIGVCGRVCGCPRQMTGNRRVSAPRNLLSHNWRAVAGSGRRVACGEGGGFAQRGAVSDDPAEAHLVRPQSAGRSTSPSRRSGS